MRYQNERGFYYKVGNYIVYEAFNVKCQADAEKVAKELEGTTGYNWHGCYTDSQPPNGFFY
jgi:hypothetical protein